MIRLWAKMFPGADSITTKLSISQIEQKMIYPDTDGLPSPDGLEQEPYFVDVLDTLKAFLEGLDVLVSGNTLIYYVGGDPSLSVGPDYYVVFGVSRAALLESHLTYRVWEAGKFPDFVLEIGSPSTADNDMGPKRDLYASLGAREYWRYDPTGGDYYGEPLVGEYLVEGEYRRFEMMDDPDGLPRAHSPLLNLDLRWEEGRLRFYDPVSGRWLESNAESIARAEAEYNARVAAEARADAAEARMDEMEAELRRLRGE